MIGQQLLQEHELKLAISPRLKQSLHMLSLPALELNEYVKELAQENPLLEIEERAGSFAYGVRTGGRPGNAGYDPLHGAPDTSGLSLERQLLRQLRELALPPALFRVAAYMAGNVTESGYLDVAIDDVCAALGVKPQTAEAALDRLQSLDPPGVGARNLRECLLLQIDRDPRRAPFAREVADRFLPQVARGELEKVASTLGTTKAHVREALAYIRALNPRPGLSASPEPPAYIVPDAIVVAQPEGFAVVMNPAGIPKLSVNNAYCRLLERADAPGASSFLRDRLKSAQWIVRCMHMRQRTLAQVVYAIMDEQQPFLREGVSGLKPLTMSDIAYKLGVHESTVSRAVRGKTVLTPEGAYPLKFFFSASVSLSDGGAMAATSVKLRLKRLIEAENKSRPYSDGQLADALAAEGVRISRRTVAKYRDELRIANASRRKRSGDTAALS